MSLLKGYIGKHIASFLDWQSLDSISSTASDSRSTAEDIFAQRCSCCVPPLQIVDGSDQAFAPSIPPQATEDCVLCAGRGLCVLSAAVALRALVALLIGLYHETESTLRAKGYNDQSRIAVRLFFAFMYDIRLEVVCRGRVVLTITSSEFINVPATTRFTRKTVFRYERDPTHVESPSIYHGNRAHTLYIETKYVHMPDYKTSVVYWFDILNEHDISSLCHAFIERVIESEDRFARPLFMDIHVECPTVEDIQLDDFEILPGRMARRRVNHPTIRLYRRAGNRYSERIQNSSPSSSDQSMPGV